jgi:hypothetical protein
MDTLKGLALGLLIVGILGCISGLMLMRVDGGASLIIAGSVMCAAGAILLGLTHVGDEINEWREAVRGPTMVSSSASVPPPLIAGLQAALPSVSHSDKGSHRDSHGDEEKTISQMAQAVSPRVEIKSASAQSPASLEAILSPQAPLHKTPSEPDPSTAPEALKAAAIAASVLATAGISAKVLGPSAEASHELKSEKLADKMAERPEVPIAPFVEDVSQQAMMPNLDQLISAALAGLSVDGASDRPQTTPYADVNELPDAVLDDAKDVSERVHAHDEQHADLAQSDSTQTSDVGGEAEVAEEGDTPHPVLFSEKYEEVFPHISQDTSEDSSQDVCIVAEGAVEELRSAELPSAEFDYDEILTRLAIPHSESLVQGEAFAPEMEGIPQVASEEGGPLDGTVSLEEHIRVAIASAEPIATISSYAQGENGSESEETHVHTSLLENGGGEETGSYAHELLTESADVDEGSEHLAHQEQSDDSEVLEAEAVSGASPPDLPVVGRYVAGEHTYVMFADGSIEANTSEGIFRFSSMDDLKAFIQHLSAQNGMQSGIVDLAHPETTKV